MKPATHTVRLGILLAVAAAFAAAALMLPPCAQPTEYHHFADTRPILGIRNFVNVATNLPFLLIGSAGLAFVLRAPRAHTAFAHRAEQWPYAVFFLAAVLTGIASAYYHLAPDNLRLFWDRLAMTVGFMSLLAAMITERVSLTAGVRLLIPLVVLGMASAGYWRVSATIGAENLIPYLAVQYGSIAIVLLIAALFRSRYARANDIYIVLALYAIAKLAESLDAWLFSIGWMLSGHSLKHLLAACAVYQVLRMLKARGPELSGGAAAVGDESENA